MWSVCVCLVLPLASQAADNLELAFSGVLLVDSCHFEQEASSQQVRLPTQTLHFFARNSRTKSTLFSLGMKGCTPTTQGKTVKLTFNSTQTQQINGIAMLVTTGDTGLVLGIEDSAGQAITLGRELQAGTIGETGPVGVNRFQFGVYALAPGAVKEGNYSATVTVKADYQ
jgi:type 1 fimbria pilin